MIEKKCKVCNNIFEIPYKKYKKETCNRSCTSIFGNKVKYIKYIKDWKSGIEDGMCGKLQTSSYIRKYLFKKYDSKCQECGWNKINETTGNIPLEIEHIDGNYRNNKEENLKLICPNCHSLTSTYRALNKGSGRKERK